MKKNLLITGGSKGLGKEIKKHYLNKNFNIINISRTKLKNSENLLNFKNDLTNLETTIKVFKILKKKI